MTAKTTLGYIFAATIGGLAAPYVIQAAMGNQVISITVGKSGKEAFEGGKGSVCDLYGAFAQKADGLVTRGGQSAKITIETSTGETCTLQNVPKPPVVVR